MGGVRPQSDPDLESRAFSVEKGCSETQDLLLTIKTTEEHSV